MSPLLLSDLVALQAEPAADAVFVVSLSGKSTFVTVSENITARATESAVTDAGHLWFCRPTPLCGSNFHQYHPRFVMAALSILPVADISSGKIAAALLKTAIPRVTFSTGIDVRRSMTLNAMRMSTELFEHGSERVFQLAQNRLDAGQTDVVHDLLVYLMEALLDIRRQFAEECTLRAESMAAYLGLSPAKVLLLLPPALTDEAALVAALQNGQAGAIKRSIDLPALVASQLSLLRPHATGAQMQQEYMLNVISSVFAIWKQHPSMQ